jgi:hypothetical protein
MNNKQKNTIIGLIVAVVVVVVIWIWSAPAASSPASPEVTALAKCLGDKDVTMYGAEWCSHCKDQKELFGDAWQHVPYVECPANPVLCTQKGVDGYPTWLTPGGKKLVGEQSLQQLADAAGCEFGL